MTISLPSRRFVAVVEILLFFILLSACTRRYSEKAAIGHFQDNKGRYLSLVVEWDRTHSNDSLSLLPWDNTIAWNGVEIVPEGDLYQVRKGKEVLAARVPFNRACDAVPVDADDLKRWIRAAKSLDVVQIQKVGAKLGPQAQYYELWLRGSLPGSYGFIFVPDGHVSALNNLSHEASRKDGPVGFTTLRSLGGGWFYFERQ